MSDEQLPLDPRVQPVPVRPGNLGRADYPRMLYHEGGAQRIVESPEEQDAYAKEGWDTVPHPVHLEPRATPSGALSIGDPLVQMVREAVRQVLEEVLDERGLGTVKQRRSHHGR